MLASCKLACLKEILQGMGAVLIAYSGGVDSTFLLKIALDTLKKNKVLAVTASSPTYPREEMLAAKKIAQKLGASHLLIQSKELDNPGFVKNPRRRCYYCKKELFSKLSIIARKKRLPYVLDGSNLDDEKDFRPGNKAAKEYAVRSPLKEAGLAKKEIRLLSKKMGLPTWNKPAYACLASRFPYGRKIEEKSLQRVAEAERYIKKQGISTLRVRDYFPLARIEVSERDIPQVIKKERRRGIIGKFKKLGYTYITLDLEGYRSGSMNL